MKTYHVWLEGDPANDDPDGDPINNGVQEDFGYIEALDRCAALEIAANRAGLCIKEVPS